MHGYLKCYYGYKNRWDELLFFGVLDWIKNYTPVTHIDIESGDVQWMQSRADKHKEALEVIGLGIDFVSCHSDESQNLRSWLSSGWQRREYDLYFFGGGEVINDQDGYKLPTKPSIKHYIMSFVSKRFTRSGRNYYLQYRKIIHSWTFFLLWGIGKPYKKTTKRLYKKLLPQAKGIVTRDITSYQLALSYNPHSTLYHDFSQYMIEQFRNITSSQQPAASSKYPTDCYILINAQDHTRSDKILLAIKAFVAEHPDKTPVYFPCDMQDDSKYFALLQKHIPSLQLYDRTEYTVFETLALFAGAAWGIGSRLHFLYPLHSFGKTYTSTATKDKVAKLLSPTPIDVV
jgi:polysaccharide pyruvyl transferase WcaK-like protein